MERVSRFRAVLLFVLFAFILMLFAGKLFRLQIIETNGNTDNTQTYTTLTTVRAARGDILDRNGNVLVGNRASYDLVFNHYVTKSYTNRNEALYRLVQKCKELDITYTDHFPVTRERPFDYTLTEMNTSWQNHFRAFMVDRGLDSDISAPLLVEKMRTRYDIPETWSDEDARAVIGFLYEFDLRGISNLPTYTFLEDVSDENLSALLELNTPGLMVESSTVREYHTKYGAHILGYLGGMSDAQWEKFQKENYSMDALVGQTGFEQAFEEYLHGIDGTRVDVVNKDGATVSQYWARGKDENGNDVVKSPVAGNNVETTIDISIQKVAEDALDYVMKRITDPTDNLATGDDTGLDAEGAAVIVMECKTGKILACASYPTFNLATMLEDWDEINNDSMKPLFNRAFGAEYAPGSTFKMCTLISAMENRNSKGEWIYTPGETIADQGVFTKYEGFAPQCLLWTSNRAVHKAPGGADMDGSWALCYSCNYFFYELGDRCTWEMVANTAQALGLGTSTGIELEEKTGALNTPDQKRKVYGSGVNSNFSAGDRVLGGIGQGENRFTPMQLAVYASTLANKGTRMKATFLSRVVSSDYRTLIKENQPEVANQMDLQSTTVETYMDGMRKVITQSGGTAQRYFGGYSDQIGDTSLPCDGVQWPMRNEITVYAKTGTAQHSSLGSDHGAFICFSHRVDETEPDLAVAVYGEKAAHGAYLAPVAEQILMAYYELTDTSEITAFENQLG